MNLLLTRTRLAHTASRFLIRPTSGQRRVVPMAGRQGQQFVSGTDPYNQNPYAQQQAWAASQAASAAAVALNGAAPRAAPVPNQQAGPRYSTTSGSNQGQASNGYDNRPASGAGASNGSANGSHASDRRPRSGRPRQGGAQRQQQDGSTPMQTDVSAPVQQRQAAPRNQAQPRVQATPAHDGGSQYQQQAPRAQPQQQAPRAQSQQQPQIQHQQAAPRTAAAPVPTVDEKHLSTMRFGDLPISPLTKRSMAEVFGYELCTHVQAQALPPALKGQDLLAKARTGTGKTLGFMIPIIEQILARGPVNGGFSALVLSPTRELANQIQTETAKLLTFHRLTAQVVVGGTNVNSDINAFKRRIPDILVATPGRCIDLMTTQEAWIGQLFRGVRFLVFDEADNLLDMGFRPAIDKILGVLPPSTQRQTLLFSATFPSDVQKLAAIAFKREYVMVDTVGEDTGTNAQVEQYSVVLPQAQQMPYLYTVLRNHIATTPDHKVIVFFTTARTTGLGCEVFEALGLPVLEMHSRKSQAHRDRVATQFRGNTGVIMFSSDVSARGVDYPDVTLVVQVGLPMSKEQYVHRLGRTARAGKQGQGLLLLADFEAPFLRDLKELPVQALPPPHESVLLEAAAATSAALKKVDYESLSRSYAAWLGYYKSCSLRLPPAMAVALANSYATTLGLPQPPALEAKLVGKMGLKGVPGINVARPVRPAQGAPPQGGGRR